jgi:hypothetical protein
MKNCEEQRQDTLNDFVKVFGAIKYSKNTFRLDVRTKIYVFLSGEDEHKIICIVKFDQVSLDDRLLRRNELLSKTINAILN